MSVSATAPTPFYQDPDRLQIPLPKSAAAGTEGTKAEGEGADKKLSMFAEGDDSPSFWDVLDIINPLQHIPIISDIYQELTGDKIGVGARLAGGALFGGPIGLIASAADCVVEEATGKDSGGHVLALFEGDEPSDAPVTKVAGADGAAPAQPAAPVQSPPAAQPSEAAAVPVLTPAPVITLPDMGAAPAMPASAHNTAIYSIGQDAPAVKAAPAAPVKATQLGPQPARMMPVPARTHVEPENAPLLSMPVSSSTARSNVPITGQVQVPAYHAVAAQNLSQGADGQTAASPDWFTAAWSEALDKYERANRRNDAVTGGASVN